MLSGTVNPIYSIILALLVYKCRQGVAPPYLADELCQPADTEARCCLHSASTSSLIVRRIRGCQPSVTELFRSPPLVPGTVFRSTSRQHRHWPSSAVASRLISSGAAFHDFTVLLSCPRSDMSLLTLIVFVTYLLTYCLPYAAVNRR